MLRYGVRTVLLLVICAGCATLSRFRFEEPTARLETVEVTGLGFSGGSLNLHFDVYNPNGYELRSTRLAAGLDLEDTHFGDALLEQPLSLPARSHTSVQVPLTFSWSGVGAGARALLSRGSVRYGLTGRILVDTPVGTRDVELRAGGSVTVRDLVR